MPNDKKNANRSDGGNTRKNDTKRVSEPVPKTGQQSQDAQRHQQDAAHHKFHSSPHQGAADTQRGQQSQGGPQQDDGDMSQGEAGQQPEIPKVGSRDAPGG
jgi:hypothetical protein